MRLALRLVSQLLLIMCLATVGYGQQSQVVNGEVRQALFDTFGTNVHMPIDVMLALTRAITDSTETPVRRRQFVQGSRLRTETGREQGQDLIDGAYSRKSLEILMALQIQPLLIADRTALPESTTVRSIHIRLESIRPSLDRQVQQANAGASALRAAALRLVADTSLTADERATASAAAERLSTLARTGQALTDDFKAEVERSLALLKPEAQSVLRALVVRADGVVGDVRAVAAVIGETAKALGTASAAPSAPMEIRGLDTKVAVEVMRAAGSLTQARQAFVGNIPQQAAALRNGLETQWARFTTTWSQSFENAQKAEALQSAVLDNVTLPPQVLALRPLVRNVQELRGVLRSDGSVDVAVGTKWLSAVGVLPPEMASADVANTIAQIAGGKADLSSSTAVVANLVAAHVNIPAIKDAAQLVSTASSLMQAAGPLLAVSGWGAGLAAFQAVGGFGALGGGGGSNNAAEFAALNQKLDKISAQLDVVITKLDQLDAKMTSQHAEVMNALEGLSFDVERTRQLLLGLAHQNVRGPCRATRTSILPAERAQFVEDCKRALTVFYAAEDTPGALTLRINLETRSIKDSALMALTQETRIRSLLVNEAPSGYCSPIVFPSRRVEDLKNKVARHSGSGGCTDAVLGSQLLEPGIVAEYIDTELEAFAATAQLPAGRAVAWWRTNGPSLFKRWSSQLVRIANTAVMQQAAIMGDVFLVPLATRLSRLSDPDMSILTDLLRADSALAHNTVRTWLYTRLQAEPMYRTRYSLAWLAGDSRLWHEITGAPVDKVVFRKIEGKVDSDDRWLIKFSSLPEVDLPKPADVMDLQLEWPVGLERAVRARNRLVEAVTSMAAVAESTGSSLRAKELLELVAVTSLVPR